MGIEIDLDERSLSYKIISWIKKVRKSNFVISGFIIITLLVGVILYQTKPLFYEPYQSHVRLAESKFFEWKKNPSNLEIFNELNELLEKDDLLMRRYEGQIAQILIDSQHTKEVFPFAKLVIKRLKQDAPYYSMYSEATFEIGQGLYEDALNHALGLKEELEISFSDRLEDDLSMGAILYGFNLIRIAFLHKTLYQAEQEILAWKNIQSFFGWNNVSSLPYRASMKVYNIILENYREKNIDLFSYVSTRLAELES